MPRRRAREPTRAFSDFAGSAAKAVGTTWAFVVAATVVLAWALTGPIFGFSDTWQLVINTGTTIVTFLMVFLIQHTQNKDTQALHLKLDELVAATRGASNELIDVEELDPEELERLHERMRKLAAQAEGSEARTVAEVADALDEVRKRIGEIGRAHV